MLNTAAFVTGSVPWNFTTWQVAQSFQVDPAQVGTSVHVTSDNPIAVGEVVLPGGAVLRVYQSTGEGEVA